MAVGNVIGSNIFNLLGIMGVASLFGDIPVPPGFLEFDLWMMFFTSLILLPFVRLRSKVGKLAGLTMILIYGVYIYDLAYSYERAAAMGMTL